MTKDELEQELTLTFEGSDGKRYEAKASEAQELAAAAAAEGVELKSVIDDKAKNAEPDKWWSWENLGEGVKGIWDDPTGEHGALAYMGLNLASGLGTAAGKVLGGMAKGAADVGFGIARGVARGVESLVGADGHAVSGFLGDWHDSFNEIVDALTPDIFEKRGMYDGIEGAHETMGAINGFAESVFEMKGMGLAAKGVSALAGGAKAAAAGHAAVAAGMGGKGYAEMAEDPDGPGGWRQELAAAAKGGIEAAMFGVLGPWKKMNMALPKPFEQLTKAEVVKRFVLEAAKSGAMMAGVAAAKEGAEALATAGLGEDVRWNRKSGWEVAKTVMSEFLVGSAFHAVNALGKSGAWLAWRADRKNGEGALTFQVEQNRKHYAPIMDRQAQLALRAREVAARDPGAKWLEASTPGGEGTENVKAVAKDGSVQFDDGSVWRMGKDGRATITVADGTILDARTGAVEGYRANREADVQRDAEGNELPKEETRAENAALMLDALERGELPTVAEPLEGLQITETSYKKGTVLDGEWDQAKAPPVVVWVGNDGTRVLITGRSRAAGAAAAGVKEIKAVEVREDQGWTRQQAKSLDAVENMREGRGTREEIARGVEALGIRSVEDCDRYEIVPERPVLDAITVVNEGSEALKSAATEGTVGRAWAAECAERLGKKSLGEASERAQATALDMIAGKLPPEEATAAMDALAELAARKPDYTDREAADAIRAARERAVGRVAVDADSEMVEMPDGTIKSVAEAKAEGAAQAQEAEAESKSLESGWRATASDMDKAAEPTVKADGSVGCVRFGDARATRTRSEDGREIVLVEGLTGEEMMRPEMRDAAVQFVTRLKEMAGDVDLVFADVSAADAAEALLMAARVRARQQDQLPTNQPTNKPTNQLVDAGQRLVDGLFGEKSGIRVRIGTEAERMEAAEAAVGKNAPVELLKDAEGETKGYYHRGKGEVVLFEGADAGTLAHEIGWHAVRHWAERNSPDLLLKMNRYAARAPRELKAAIKEAYGDFTGDALLDEIGAGRFERAMGERFQKLLAKSPEVRSWWRKVLHALARAWKGLARTVGGNRIDLKKIEKMDPEEAIEALTAQMLEGRRLGEGGGAGKGIRPSIGGIYTGTAADYANRSRQGGVDDGPSLKKIGTGEGSQVYGWGLYGSTVRGVAEKYAMPSGLEIRRHGNVVKPWNDKIAGLIRNNFSSRNPIESALKEAKENGWDQKDIESLENGDYEVVASHSNLYEQTFFTDRAPGDESHLLKWYEPVSEEQLGWVRNAAEKEGVLDDRFKKFLDVAEKRINGEVGDKANGESLYLHVEWALGSPQAASEFLARAGIDGVKYPVDSYGGKSVKDGDEAGWNYVAFSDEHIRVDHKWTDGQIRFSRSLATSALGDGKQKYYEVPFDKAVDKIVKNRKPIGNEHVFISETPGALKEIGIPALPVMMNQSHILSCYYGKGEGVKAGNMQGLGDRLKALPKALSRPMMVIANDSNPSSSVIAIVKMLDRDGHTVIAPVEINGIGQLNDGRITANLVKTAFGKRNIWSEKVAKALRDEVDGKIGVFYIDSNEARGIESRLAREAFSFGGAERQLLRRAKGTVHSISDYGSPVKGVGAQKDSQQFKRWFADSKVVDEKGEPLVVYRGSPYDPLAQEAGKGVIKPEAYFTADPEYAKRYTGNGGKVGAYYLNIRRPFDIRDPECLKDLQSIFPDHEFIKGKSGALDWGEASIVDGEFLRENFGDKYDGIVYDEGGDPTGSGVKYRGVSYVPLDGGAQVKSATDNIGTFDPGNPDIRYARGGKRRDEVYTVHSISDYGSPVKGVGAQKDSQQFKRWFADSKVVDEKGEPLVVWHGTPKGDFTVFDKSKIGSTTNRQNVKVGELGFYFTNDRGAAQNYAEYLGSSSDPRTMGVYLNLKNPLVVKDSGWGSAADQADARRKDLARWAKEGGHDGIIVQSTDEILENGMPDTVYIAFEPSQVKSATDNIGTFDPGNPDIRYSRAPRKTKEEEKFAAAVGGLTARGKNGTLAAVDQKRLTAVMRGLGSGELKHPRFTREEAAASGGTEHERLWNYILSLESPDIHAGGAEAVGGGEGGADPQGGGWLGRLRRMATRYEGDPKEIAAGEHKYLDRGAESSVYDAGDGTVVKVRKLPLNSAEGVKDALAKLVYHNYLFPKDAYTLRDIAVWDNNGYDQFYLILEQPLVTPKTDAAGNIVAPSEGQIFEALKKANRRFRMHDEALERRAEDEFDTTDGDGSSADFVPAARKIAYTDQFVVYDFKPGRNTFIDAETGEVRFIDPRVEVNDPGAGFSVSRFGKRKSVNGTASFEGAPSGEMEGVRYSRRGGKRRDEVYDDVLRAVRAGGQRVAAGRSERTEAGFDAGAALWMEREGQLGKSQDGSMTLSYSEALRLYRAMSASAHMPKVLEKMPHLATRDRKGRLRLNAAAFGIVDKSDLEAVKAGLKKDGMFLHEDPSWRLHNDYEEVRAMKEMSEQALAEEMEKLAEARITGKMSGGGRTAVNILAKEIGRIACELPVTAGAPQSLKDLRKLGLGIARELGDPKGELGKEAREAARWWREQDPVRKDTTATKSEDIAESELWAEMFGMFLADPMALQERAPNVYGKMVEAIAGNEKLSEAWNGLRRTRDAEGPHERVMRDIERQWSVNEQQAYKELLAELDKPIGTWGKRTKARLLLELHSAEGPAVMWVTDAVRERLAELKRLKKAGKIDEKTYDLLAGGAKRELEKIRVALLHKQRGGGTGRLYVLDFASGVMEDVARDGVDMGDLRRYMYAKSVRDGLHQKGKAAALGMDQREAQKVLEELEGRLGADGWAKLETAAKRFQATREQHLLENEFVLEAFGRDLVNYWKMNASYVRSERTWTAEEVAAYEAARSDWMARHPGESTVIAEIEALMDMHGAKGSGTAGGAFLKPLAGSLKAVKDPIAATLENDLRIIEFAQRNHWACQLAESAKTLNMEGFAVMEDRGGGGKLRGSNRYGSVSFLKDGKRMTLVMPKVVAEGFEYDAKDVSKLVKLNRWASAILTQYSLRFALRNIWRNRASNANNIAWMGEGRLVTGMGMVGMRPVARLATFLLERAASHLPDRFARNALMNVLYGSKTNLYWEAEATRLAKMMQDPQLLRRRAEEANSLMLQGKSAEAQRLWDDIQKCQEFMKLPIFAGVRKQIMGESGKAELDELMRSLNLETNFDGTKLTGLKRAKRWMQRRAETVKRFNDFEEARVKLIALLAAQHEAELAQARGEAAPRSRDEITYQVATMSGSPRYENRGRAMNYIEFACGPFMNVGMKGAWRTVESMRYDPKSWWTKAAGRIAGRLATSVLWMGGGYKVLAEILRESAGDDDEKKKRVDAFERFGRRMAHALANVSDYRLRNYDIVPVGLFGKWSTLAISMPRGDEDRLLMPTVDLLANGLLGSEKAQEMGFALPMDLNYTGAEALQNTVLNSGLVPDLTRRGLLMSLFQDAIGPLVGWNPYNTFTQRTVYSEADFESRFADPGNMASKVAKQLWNDLGGQVVMPATTWDEDEGAYDDQGQWALSGAEEGEAGCMPIGGKTIFQALHSIPFLSAAASGLITFQNGGNERIARRLEKYRRDDSAPLRAAAQRVADEVIEAVRANGEDFDYSEMLEARVSELELPEEEKEIIEGLAFKKVQGIAAKMGSEFDPIGKALEKMSTNERMYKRAKRQVEAEGWDGYMD